jgi:phage shock protein PspC (stress-responsive transcriptional regulator)
MVEMTRSNRITSEPPSAEPAGLGSFPLLGEELYKLKALRECGALTEDEFVRAKALVLGGQQAGCSAATASRDLRRQLNWLQRLARSRRGAVLGGVCAGLAEQTPLPAWCWRLLFCLAGFVYGIGALVYLLAWVFVPNEVKGAEAGLPAEQWHGCRYRVTQ